MAATLSTVDAILKEIYGPRIEDQLQSEVVGSKRIERTSDGVVETVGGKYVDFPIRVARNHGIGYRNENEKLPKAGQQGYAEVHVPLRYGYGRVRLTGQVMNLAETNAQAFASAMDREMNGLKDDLVKDQNRIFYGNGTGLMATITSSTLNSTTHTVDSSTFLGTGAQVDVLVKSNGNTVVLDTEIVSVDGNTVVFANAFDGGGGVNGIYRQGSFNREPSGLGNIVSNSGTLHGVDPTTQPLWKSTVKGNGGTNRALSESLMIEAADDVRKKGGKLSLWLTSLGVRRAYFNLLTQQRRYADSKEFAGGFTGLAFNYGKEIPVVEDVDHPENTMYGLDEDKFKIYRNKPWHWAEDDGTILKWVTDYDAWEAIKRQYSELGTAQRNAHVRIDDITEG